MKKSVQIEIVLLTLIVLSIIGTLSYHYIEGWGYLDSFYFTAITLTTIGYGDLTPTTPISKIFTVFFAFVGVGLSLFALSLIATSYFESRERKLGLDFQKKIAETMKNNRKTIQRKKKEIIKGSRY